MMAQLCITKMPRLLRFLIAVLCAVTGVCVIALALRAVYLFPLPSEGFGRSRNLGAFATAIDGRNRGYTSGGNSDRVDYGDETASRGSTATAPREMSFVSASSSAQNRLNAARGWSADSSSSSSNSSNGSGDTKKPTLFSEASVNQVNPMLDNGLTSALLDEQSPQHGNTASRLFRRFRTGRQEKGGDEASITKTQVDDLQ